MATLIERLEGPVLVLGSTGFIGRRLLGHLHDAKVPALGGNRDQTMSSLRNAKPKIVFNCIGYGADKYETSAHEMQMVNFVLVQDVLSELRSNGKSFTFINAGSSTEYGTDIMAPDEDTSLRPTTPYGVSKAAAALHIHQEGKTNKSRVANLRLYNVYGPGDHSNTLISTVVAEGKKGQLPEFKNPATNRDFVHVDDVCRAFIHAAVNLKEDQYGESFNIGGDVRTLEEVAKYARNVFKITADPVFDMKSPVQRWCAAAQKAEMHLNFKSTTSLVNGLKKLAKEKECL